MLEHEAGTGAEVKHAKCIAFALKRDLLQWELVHACKVLLLGLYFLSKSKAVYVYI